MERETVVIIMYLFLFASLTVAILGYATEGHKTIQYWLKVSWLVTFALGMVFIAILVTKY